MVRKINKKEAEAIAKEQGYQCGFVGNLDEVWEHGKREHEWEGRGNVERLDGAQFGYDGGELGDNPTWFTMGDILVNEKGEYWYVCSEKIESKEKIEPAEVIIYDGKTPKIISLKSLLDFLNEINKSK